MKKLGLFAISFMAVSLLVSCGGKKPAPTEDVKFSVQESSVTLDDDQVTIHLDWTPNDHSIEFSNFVFSLKDQTSITSIVTPKEATARPLELAIAFNSDLNKSDVGNLKFHFNDKTTKKEGEGKVEGISITVPKNTFDIHFEGEFCTINGDFNFSDTVIKDKENAKYTIVPSDGYNLPERIGMPEGITYQYDKNTGVINIDKVSKDINKITATAILDESYCAFHFEGTNCSISGIKDFDDTIKKGGTNIKYTISPDVGYKLPTKVEPEGKVSYDNTTGVITISEMTDNISITASTTEQFKEEYSISFIGTDCTATGEGITSQDMFNITATNTDELQFTIAPIGGYKLTNNIDFEIDNVAAEPTDYSYSPETGDTGNYILKFYPKGETFICVESEVAKEPYTVTFDANGGSAVNPITVERGEKIEPPTAPTRNRYAFNGWYYDDGTFQSKFDFETTSIYENLELHASWELSDVVVTFDAGEGSRCEIYNDQLYQIGVKQGTKFKDIDVHIYGGYKKDYEFLCWTLDGVNPISDDYVFNKSTILQAKYVGVSQEYLTLTPRSNATLTINPPGNGNRTFSYQITGKTGWITFTSSTSVDLDYGRQIYIKGTDNVAIGKTMFSSAKYFSVSGPCSSLFADLSYLPNYAFNSLFYNFNLVSAHNLSLPETTLVSGCYTTMFYGNTKLISAPYLPATTLAIASYLMMFSKCSSLKISDYLVPVVNKYDYSRFFTAPSDPDEVSNACTDMFNETGGTYTNDPYPGGNYFYYI